MESILKGEINMQDHNNKGGSFGKLLMVICILVPVIAMVLFIFRPDYLSGNSYLLYAMFLLCPLSHLFMMKFMHKPEQVETPSSEKN